MQQLTRGSIGRIGIWVFGTVSPMIWPTMPTWVGYPIVFVCAAMALYGVFGPDRPVGFWVPWFGRPWPDYEKWDKKQRLQLYEAACLWVECEPVLPMPRKAKAKYDDLKEKAVAGVLPVETSEADRVGVIGRSIYRGNNDWVDPHSTADRNDLVSLAEGLNERPRFLFRIARET
jgi:hypothetical protein